MHMAGSGSSTLRVSSETSFASKQPKLEPKLVSALSEKKYFFRLFHLKVQLHEIFWSEFFHGINTPLGPGYDPKMVNHFALYFQSYF